MRDSEDSLGCIVVAVVILVFAVFIEYWDTLLWIICAIVAAVLLFFGVRYWIRERNYHNAELSDAQNLPRIRQKARREIQNCGWWGAMPRNAEILLDTNVWMQEELDEWFAALPELLHRRNSKVVLPGFILDEVQNHLRSRDKGKKYLSIKARERITMLQTCGGVISREVSVRDKKAYADPLIIGCVLKNPEIVVYTFDKMLLVRMRAKFSELNKKLPVIFSQDQFVAYEWLDEDSQSSVSYNPSKEVMEEICCYCHGTRGKAIRNNVRRV